MKKILITSFFIYLLYIPLLNSTESGAVQKLKKLNYPWVEFAGWVKSAEEEYSKASFIFSACIIMNNTDLL